MFDAILEISAAMDGKMQKSEYCKYAWEEGTIIIFHAVPEVWKHSIPKRKAGKDVEMYEWRIIAFLGQLGWEMIGGKVM